VKEGQIIQIRHTHRNVRHWQYERYALRYDGRIGMIIEKLDTKAWISIYRILIGKHKIELGKGWIISFEKIPVILSNSF